MDFKKFGNVVLLLGALVFAYGGLQWLSNQHITDAPFSNGVQYGAWERGAARHAAGKAMQAGLVVALVGLGIGYSAQKK